MDRRKRDLSPDEFELWTHVTKSVRPRKSASLQMIFAPTVSNHVVKPHKIHLPPQEAISPRVKREPVGKEPPLVDMDRRQRSKVVRGKSDIDAAIDLHGLRQHEAHDALRSFLRWEQAIGARLILVVTGVGRRSPDHDNDRPWDDPGVLRRQVPTWLRATDLRDVVMGFEIAAIKHGGAGALYVRLRRHGKTRMQREIE